MFKKYIKKKKRKKRKKKKRKKKKERKKEIKQNKDRKVHKWRILQVGEIKSQPDTTIFKFKLLTDETSDHHTDDVRLKTVRKP